MANINSGFTYQNNELPDNYIYISHLEEDFQFWRLPCTPESVTDSLGSTFGETSALGRTAPVYTYSHSGPRTVVVNLDFRRDMMDEMNSQISNVKLDSGEDYMDSLIKALQAISLPKYNLSNKAIEPPMVALRLSNEIFIKGVVNQAITITYKLPILSNGKYAGVSLSLTISEVDPTDSTEVFKNGSFLLWKKY
mgnify:CR=1 FL=1